jgi:hypothetical protein
MFDLPDGFEVYRPPRCRLCNSPARSEAFRVANLVVCCDCDGTPPVEDWAFELGMDLDQD